MKNRIKMKNTPKIINPLRTRVFTRYLQLDLLGTSRTTPCAEDCRNALIERGLDSSKLSESTWGAWWHGQRTINPTNRAELNAVTQNLASKWLEPCLVNNRLACHICCFDLPVIVAREGIEKAISRAWEILREVHKGWAVTPHGEIRIQNSTEREREDVFIHRGFSPKSVSIPKLQPITLDKAKQTELITPAHKKTVPLYEPLNPSSIVLFLLNYGLQAWDSEPGLAESLAIDLTTAMHALVFIIFANQIVPSTSGEIGKIAVALFDFWHNDQEFNFADKWALFHALSGKTRRFDLSPLVELRQSYRNTMKLTGLSVTELSKLATDTLRAIPQKKLTQN
ncbi:hypothetical protein [Cellvibrio sp.]|uniref:hypothetical protein n=1 Tax=Cellvibrio sp. TaxID=1965322 RepID=UPI003964756C